MFVNGVAEFLGSGVDLVALLGFCPLHCALGVAFGLGLSLAASRCPACSAARLCAACSVRTEFSMAAVFALTAARSSAPSSLALASIHRRDSAGEGCRNEESAL